MIDVRDALKKVLEHTPRQKPVTVPLAEAPGTVCAEEILSDVDLPPFDRATKDGYAVRSADAQDCPASLRFAGEVAAGAVPELALAPGQAARIMTGAMLPSGADAVQAIERCHEEGARIILYDPVAPGENVARCGSELRRGEVALPKDAFIGAPEIGVLAAVGREKVLVVRRPRVAVLTSGDELVEVGGIPRAGEVRNSNLPALTAAVALAGAVPVPLGIARDEEKALAASIGKGLREDFLLVSGGVSVGRYDLTPGVLRGLGVTMHFDRIAMKPGKPLHFGTRGETCIFGLPGNPVSALTCFLVFVLPALRKAMGRTHPEGLRKNAVLARPVDRNAERTGYLLAWTEWTPAGLRTRTVESRGSGDVCSLARANSLLVAPRGEPVLAEGRTVEVLLHPDFLERQGPAPPRGQ